MNKICSFIRFKAKEGCEDEFLAELKAANMESKNFPTKYKHKVCEIGSILDKSIINNLTLKKNDADNSFSIKGGLND